MKVRKYRSEDCEKIAELFYNTVHSVNSADYTDIQVNAWAPKDMDLTEWNNRLSNNANIELK